MRDKKKLTQKNFDQKNAKKFTFSILILFRESERPNIVTSFSICNKNAKIKASTNLLNRDKASCKNKAQKPTVHNSFIDEKRESSV